MTQSCTSIRILFIRVLRIHHFFYLYRILIRHTDPADNTTVIKSIYVDNGGNLPAAEFATSTTRDSGRTYIVGTDELTSFEFDFFYVTNAGT